MSLHTTDVKSITYDSTTHVLSISTKKEGILRYFDVPENVFHEFTLSKNKDVFRQNFIDPVYKPRRMGG